MLKLAQALASMFLVVLVAELAASAWMRQTQSPHAYDEPRNPHYRRDWTRFTEPRPRDANTSLVVLIGNSQAFGSELPDGEQVYAHQLELQLREELGTDVTVANWSSGGIGGPEMYLLALRAIQHEPDLVLIVTHARPFTEVRTRPTLDFFNSDINELAYLDPIREAMPGRFVDRHAPHDPVNFLSVHSGLVQVHNRYVEKRNPNWTRYYRPPVRPPEPRSYPMPKLGSYGQWLYQNMVRKLRRNLPETPVVLVNMPLSERFTQPRAYERFNNWTQVMDDAAGGDELVITLDAQAAIPDRLFYTASHLKPAGHARLAGWLAPHVADLLTHDPPATGPGD